MSKNYEVLNELVPKTQELHRAIFDKGYEQGQHEVLDDIRAEIESISLVRDEYSQRQNDYCDGCEFIRKQMLQILDKYKGEVEVDDNIQIVIEIPHQIYEASQLLDVKYEDTVQIPLECIANGTPLPKGHGKLIDEKEIDTVVNGDFCAYDKYSPKTFLDVIHSQCIETVGADGAEKRNKK